MINYTFPSFCKKHNMNGSIIDKDFIEKSVDNKVRLLFEISFGTEDELIFFLLNHNEEMFLGDIFFV